MARTLELKAPTGLTLTVEVVARGTNVVTETITLTEKTVAKQIYTGTIATAAAGDYELSIKSGSSYIGADEVRIEATDATTYRARSMIDIYANRTVIRGTVGATSPSVNSFTPSALEVTGAAADQLKGRVILFDKDTTTLALRGQGVAITASSLATLPLLTYTTLTTAPVSGDTFGIY